jgi:hypothetical protein
MLILLSAALFGFGLLLFGVGLAALLVGLALQIIAGLLRLVLLIIEAAGGKNQQQQQQDGDSISLHVHIKFSPVWDMGDCEVHERVRDVPSSNLTERAPRLRRNIGMKQSPRRLPTIVDQ